MTQSYSLTFDATLHLVIAQFNSMDESSFQSYLDDLTRHGPYDAHWNLVVVMPSVEHIDIETRQIRDAAKRPQLFSLDARRVIIAADDLAFGLARVFGSEHTSDQYTVVKTVAEAEQILGREFSHLLANT